MSKFEGEVALSIFIIYKYCEKHLKVASLRLFLFIYFFFLSEFPLFLKVGKP